MAILKTVMDVIAAAQTEILIFMIAVCAHFLLFSKHRVHAGKSSVKKLPKESSKNAIEKPSPRRAAGDSSANPLLRPVTALLSERPSRDALVAELSRRLGMCPQKDRAELVAGLLSSLTKGVTRDLVGACRSVARELRFEGAQRLNEMMLRSYILVRAKDDFESFLAELSAPSRASQAIALLALRGACTFGDVDAAFDRLPGAASAWQADSKATPSATPQQLFQQLARLSLAQDKLPRLLEEMRAHSLVNSGTMQALFQECGHADMWERLQTVKEFASTEGFELTPACCVSLIRAAPNAETGIQLIKDAVVSKRLSKEVLVAGASAAASFNDSDLAKLVLEHLPAAPSPEAAHGLLLLCSKGGPLAAGCDSDALVLELYEAHLSGSGFGLEARAERVVAEAALRHGRDDVLASWVGQLSEVSRQVLLLKSFSKDRRLGDCMAIYRACSEKSAPLCNAMLDACVDNGDLVLAEKVMGEALDAKIADIVTYNTMIKAYLRQGGIRRVRAFVETMQQKGMKPNSVTYNELLDGVIRERPEEMWGVISEMRAVGCRPNHVTCSIVLKSVSKTSRANEVEQALSVVDAMDDPMDEVLLSSICEACIRSGRTDLLRRQLERQGSMQIKGAQTYGSIIRAYGSLNDVDKVWDTWREMRKRCIVPTSVTIGCTVEALAANGQVDAAYELIREQLADPQVRPLVNAVIFCSVLKGFSHRKRFDRVWAVYEEMKAAKLECSVVTFNTLVDACARSGEMGRVPQLLDDMGAQGIEPNLITYTAVIKGYCQHKRLDSAFELLEDMKRSRNLIPDEVTYNTLIDGCARYGMYERGIAVLREMKENGVPPSNFTLSVLVKLASRCKRPDGAFELCEKICAEYGLRLCVHVFNNLIHACTSSGDFPRALKVAARMLGERVRPDTRTYSLLLWGALAERAQDDIAGLLRAAARLPGAHPMLLNAASSAMALTPKGGLSREAVSEALEGIANFSTDKDLAGNLLRELRSASGVSVDPRLPMRLAARR
eukprot:CAMPEP_0176074026 /NCGR_PEP_ID=MMETSP0120_2-20121206/36991_1 /TAXON_ID=160619 /ORGANISM="Kryptoperidinium foliaceum, Strain CCMP 1326" /LENGTH=1009 /DNA_ID=CAMNT_0017407715 /DNA_START=80 /DNA_END=3109 /DNA_ORIENTATION=-